LRSVPASLRGANGARYAKLDQKARESLVKAQVGRMMGNLTAVANTITVIEI
jgi:hypothetical protein